MPNGKNEEEMTLSICVWKNMRGHEWWGFALGRNML